MMVEQLTCQKLLDQVETVVQRDRCLSLSIELSGSKGLIFLTEVIESYLLCS